MGIFCEISVNKPPDGDFRPGDQVLGAIKYAVDEDTVFSKITVSLKGIGRIKITDHNKKNSPTYKNKETYIDIDQVHSNEKEETTVKGLYESLFQFELPAGIPPSVIYKRHGGGHTIHCKIIYYIRIKFQRPGFLEFDKRFKKEISVRAGLTPTLTSEPIISAQKFKIVTTRSDKTIEVKACIENPVIAPNGKIKFSYEVINNSTVKLEGVKIKVKERYTFKAKGLSKVKKYSDIDGTHSKSGPIAAGDTQTMEFEIDLPDVRNIQNSVIISRDYFVKLKVLLPVFRINRELHIPFQVGDVIEDRAGGFDAPPSYWEAMGECGKERLSDDDDDEEKY